MIDDVDFDLVGRLASRAELHAAADWWAQQLLGGAFHNSGDATIDAVASFAAGKLKPISEWQVKMFRNALVALLAVRCAASGWKEDDPNWAAAHRGLHADYGPDCTIRAALEYAMIGDGELRVPIKTSMWVNPGSVKVRHGYGSSVTVLYPAAEVPKS